MCTFDPVRDLHGRFGREPGKCTLIFIMIDFVLAKKENIVVPNAVEKSRTGAFRSQDHTLSFFFRLKKKQSFMKMRVCVLCCVVLCCVVYMRAYRLCAHLNRSEICMDDSAGSLVSVCVVSVCVCVCVLCICECKHACMHTYIYACMHTYINTQGKQ